MKPTVRTSLNGFFRRRKSCANAPRYEFSVLVFIKLSSLLKAMVSEILFLFPRCPTAYNASTANYAEPTHILILIHPPIQLPWAIDGRGKSDPHEVTGK